MTEENVEDKMARWRETDEGKAYLAANQAVAGVPADPNDKPAPETQTGFDVNKARIAEARSGVENTGITIQSDRAAATRDLLKRTQGLPSDAAINETALGRARAELPYEADGQKHYDRAVEIKADLQKEWGIAPVQEQS